MIHQMIGMVLFFLLALIGIILTIFGIGGTFVILIGALLLNLVSWSMTISFNTLMWMTGLAVLGELLEWLITLIGVKAQGVSKYGLIGTVVGAVIGAIVLSVVPIIGTMIGIVLGAILGAFLLEYAHTGKTKKAWKAAKAALLGRALVSLTKLIIAIIMVAIVIKEIL